MDLQPTETLTKVFLPYTQKLEYVKEFKQAHRRDDDIAIANAGMRVQFKQSAEGVILAIAWPYTAVLSSRNVDCNGSEHVQCKQLKQTA